MTVKDKIPYSPARRRPRLPGPPRSRRLRGARPAERSTCSWGRSTTAGGPERDLSLADLDRAGAGRARHPGRSRLLASASSPVPASIGYVRPSWGARVTVEMGDSHLGVEHALLAMIRDRETVGPRRQPRPRRHPQGAEQRLSQPGPPRARQLTDDASSLLTPSRCGERQQVAYRQAFRSCDARSVRGAGTPGQIGAVVLSFADLCRSSRPSSGPSETAGEALGQDRASGGGRPSSGAGCPRLSRRASTHRSGR